MLNYRRNFFLFFRTIWGTLCHTDWDAAYIRAGVWGTLRAFCAGMLGLNAWPFFVRANAGWTPEQISRLLQAKGVASWGWGYHGGEFFCRVRLRQAHWAQYILLEHGVPLTGNLLAEDGRYQGWGTPPQSTAGTYNDDMRRAPRDQSAGRAAQGKTVVSDPVAAINRVVDKLAGF